MTRAVKARMTPRDLQERTLKFALDAYGFAKPMLQPIETRHISQQLIRASTSVAANHRAAGLARSRREFVAKIGTVREEADESAFWMLFIHRAGLATGAASEQLRRESQELAAIFRAAYRTAKRRLKRRKVGRQRQVRKVVVGTGEATASGSPVRTSID